MTPATKVVRVETQQMIADSFGEQSGKGNVKNGLSTSDGLGRGGSSWDDED